MPRGQLGCANRRGDFVVNLKRPLGGTYIMDFDKISRRHLLKTDAATGAGLVAASSGLPVFAQDKPSELDVPQGARGSR